MRIAAAVSALTLLLALAASPTTAAAAEPTAAVNFICEQAFAEAAASPAEEAGPEVLDDAVRSCSSASDFAAAAAIHPGPLGDVDARTFLRRRCFDESAGLEGYATCHDIVHPSEAAGTGSLVVRSNPAVGNHPRGRTDVGLEIILDTSSSMRRPVGDVRRIDAAKDALRTLVGSALSEGVPLVVRTFGIRPGKKAGRCYSLPTAPLASLDGPGLEHLIGSLDANAKAKSPIAESIAAVADDLATVEGAKAVVLITDGDENCGGDPVAEIERLRAADPDVSVNVVGFALDDDLVRDTMQTWASAGAGRYYDAANTDELAAALSQAVAPVIDVPFRVVGAEGQIIADGVVDGEPVEVAAGRYRIVVTGEAGFTMDGIVVTGGETTEITLPAPD